MSGHLAWNAEDGTPQAQARREVPETAASRAAAAYRLVGDACAQLAHATRALADVLDPASVRPKPGPPAPKAEAHR